MKPTTKKILVGIGYFVGAVVFALVGLDGCAEICDRLWRQS